ncbi:hypothetical protein DAEQUDRAFT_727772 [Daedalea quercina L-15889]|uniref:F-box domain-containing protein n=1 Tax=Daedalea quercina L-15889 TaxID=1314783 RepID=A0A165PNL4_9APHY|nr:hypothetical protein DAEQUDRAFT_727772 [Daedalea quercina L-15889]
MQGNINNMSLNDMTTAERELTSAVVSLRSALNTAAPFHRLPIELMKAIFTLVPTMQYRITSVKKQSPIVDVWERRHFARMSELYTLMLVCRQWRDIVTGTPSFWNTIDQAYPLSQTAFLERSGYGLLKVVLHKTPSAFMSTLCDTENARIVELHHSSISAATAEEYLGFSAPALEVLHLTNSWFFGRYTLTESGKVVQLCREQTPRLHQLSLHHIHWFPVVQVTALTHLDVDMCRWDDHLVKIMGILASAPLLTDLVLSSLSCVTSDVDSLNTAYPDYSVSLPHLERLHMRYAHSEGAIVGILAKLSLPPTAAIDMDKATDARHFTEGVLPTLYRLPVMQTVDRASLVFFSVAQEPRLLMTQLTAVGAASGVVCTPLGLHCSLHSLTSVLPVHRLRELWLTALISNDAFMDEINLDHQPEPPFELESDTLRELLRPMNALETLVVWGQVLPNVLEGLVDHEATATRPLCPKLTNLRIMLSKRSPPVDDLITLLDVQQDILRFRHVEVNYLRKYAGPRMERTEFDHHFTSIVYASRDFAPILIMPPVCRRDAHARWMRWSVDEEGLLAKHDGEVSEEIAGEYSASQSAHFSLKASHQK